MIHTIKSPETNFNLLFLEYSEYLINSSSCLYLNLDNSLMEKATLHINTRSFIIEPENLHLPCLKLFYSEAFSLKLLTIEDIINYFHNFERYEIKTYKTNNFNSNNAINKKPTTIVNKNYNLNNNTNNNSNTNLIINIKSCGLDIKLTNLHDWMNKYVFNQDNNSNNNNNKEYRNELNNKVNYIYNLNTINNKENNNLIFNNKNSEIGRNKNDDNDNIKIHELKALLSQNNYNYHNFMSILNGLNEAYPLSNNFISNYKNYFSTGNLTTTTNNNNNNNLRHSENNSSSEINKYDNNNNNNIKEESSKSQKYLFLLIKTNKQKRITRLPSVKYDLITTAGIHLIILSLSFENLKLFLEDKMLAEYIYNCIYDEREAIKYIINKKIEDSLENFKLKRDCLANDKTISIGNYKILSKCSRILPEGIQEGLFIINRSNEAYFIPSINNYKYSNSKDYGKHFNLCEVHYIIKYRYLYKNKALNIGIYKGRRSLLLDFDSVADMEKVKKLLEQECCNYDTKYNDVKYHTNLWVNGHITNYDYLLYLNFMASRSFNDTSQYPVFPWVITNYSTETEDFSFREDKNFRDLSKPVGALNQKKLEKLKKNSNDSEMSHIYQCHYSTPFMLSYYFVRAFPHFSLRLNSYKHEVSDRVFYSLKECWKFLYSSTTNQVYELTPEFFNSDGEFLLNINNVSFDLTQEGKSIDNVVLPKWAKTPKEFININRAVLESEYVSLTLNNWIDLIFGYKQRGKEAQLSNNLFSPESYDTDNNVNYDDFDDKKKQDFILKLLELGQVPRQLFTEPHPEKNSSITKKIATGPTEEVQKKIKDKEEEYKKNEKLYEELEYQNEIETNKLIADIDKQLEFKKTEINNLERNIQEKEKNWNINLNDLVSNNNKLKQSFELYDLEKNEYYKNLINNWQTKQKYDIEKKFKNKEELFIYVKELESDINRYKTQEKEYEEVIVDLKNQLTILKNQDTEAKLEINKIKEKLNI